MMHLTMGDWQVELGVFTTGVWFGLWGSFFPFGTNYDKRNFQASLTLGMWWQFYIQLERFKVPEEEQP